MNHVSVCVATVNIKLQTFLCGDTFCPERGQLLVSLIGRSEGEWLAMAANTVGFLSLISFTTFE